MKNKQIIFVLGIMTGNSIESRWKKWLCEIFPYDEVIMIGEFYTYFDYAGMQKRVKKIIELIENKKETILIGHSFGSLIMTSALAQSKENNVTNFISIFSPHKLNIFGMKKRKNLIGYSNKIDKKIKVKSYGAYIDHLAPFFLTKIGNEKHKNYFTDHYIELSRSERFFKKLILDGLNENKE